MATLTILVGAPASGKSTYARKRELENDNVFVISTDEIRKELFGDEDCQEGNDEVFSTAYDAIRYALKKDRDVIFDATNVHRKGRMKLIREFKRRSEKISAVVMPDYTIEELMEHDAQRSRHVPQEVIERMLTGLKPTEDEGFDEIIQLEKDWNEVKEGDEDEV